MITYFSCSLSRPGRNYCVTPRELLAVILGTHHFRAYLFGRRFPLRTNHASLTWQLNFRELKGQLARWLESLQDCDFEIMPSSCPPSRQCRCSGGHVKKSSDGIASVVRLESQRTQRWLLCEPPPRGVTAAAPSLQKQAAASGSEQHKAPISILQQQAMMTANGTSSITSNSS